MTMTIKILGTGCRNCVTLDRVTREAVIALALDASVEKVEDYPTITAYGVMTTPALVIDEQVVLAGRVPTPTALRELLTTAATHHDQATNIIEGNDP
jgi:small redox-active disulfide protein 2